MAIILPCPLDEPASALRPYNKMAKKALAAYNNEKVSVSAFGSQSSSQLIFFYKLLLLVLGLNPFVNCREQRTSLSNTLE